MKKRLFAVPIILVIAISLISTTGCSVGKQYGYAAGPGGMLPDKTVPLNTAQTDTSKDEPSPWVKEMLKSQAQTNSLLGQLIVTIKNDKKTESSSGPGPYASRANGKTDTKKTATVSKTPVTTKVVTSGVSQKEFNQLKDRVANHDNTLRLIAPDVENGKVEFSRGSSTLSEDDKKYLKDLAERWFAGLVDISMIIGNADPTKPKMHGMSNLDYARNRLNEVTAFLGNEGVDLGDTRTFTDETNMYSNSCNTSFVNKKVTKPEEISSRKQARAELRKMPLTNGMTLNENKAAMSAEPMVNKTEEPAPTATTVEPKKEETPAPAPAEKK